MEKNKLSDYIDTEFSSGDSKMMQPKQCRQEKPKEKKHKEENNNEVDELTKDFSEMGCIVDPVKRPPNICIENCVYEESSGGEEGNENNNEDGDRYSDEFEEDKSEDEELKLEPESVQSVTSKSQGESDVILIKSQSSMSSKPSLSGRSTGYGSLSTRPRRTNMSFSNERLREIERHNHILLGKILAARHEPAPAPPAPRAARRPVPPAAMQRKTLQKKIDHDNMILLKKIQRAKSSSYSVRR